MVFVQKLGVMAKAEPMPRKKAARQPPHFLVIPADRFEHTECINRTVFDKDGFLDTKEGVLKNQSCNYLFLKNNATAVAKKEHADILLQELEQTGIYEVGVMKAPDRVEHFHPTYNDRFRRGEYNPDEGVEVKTVIYKPVMSHVVRTGKDVVAGKKLDISDKDRLVDAAQVVIDESSDTKPRTKRGTK